MTKIYIVGECGYDHHWDRYVCGSIERALDRFEQIRLEFIEENKRMIDYEIRECPWNHGCRMRECELESYYYGCPYDHPHGDRPFIEEMELDE